MHPRVEHSVQILSLRSQQIEHLLENPGDSSFLIDKVNARFQELFFERCQFDQLDLNEIISHLTSMICNGRDEGTFSKHLHEVLHVLVWALYRDNSR